MQLSTSSIKIITTKCYVYVNNKVIKTVDKKNRTTIQLNGQRYNAISGSPINTIDGVIRKPVQNNYSQHLTTKNNNQPKTQTVHHIHNLEKKPTPSQTLMRQAVTKPTKSTRLITKINTPINQITNSPKIVPPTFVGNINPRTATRARTYAKSPQIDRYGAAVKTAPRPSISFNQQPIRPIEPAKKDLYDLAIAKAKAHEQPPLTRKELKRLHPKHFFKGKALAYTAVVVMGLSLLGFGVYQNIPNLMAKVASIKAGFAVHLPGYKPSGFSLASVGYQPGTVQFAYNSNIDKRHFTLTEHSSNWDSATLVSSIVIPTQGHNYQKITVAGQSIYLYGKDQAAWVSNGIWYQVQGNSSLSTNQIIKLATTV